MRSGPVPTKRTLLLLCTLVSFSTSCETGTFNPWLSPTHVDVEGECDVFTGRIVADDWAGRPIKTKHGVRYQASTRSDCLVRCQLLLWRHGNPAPVPTRRNSRRSLRRPTKKTTCSHR